MDSQRFNLAQGGIFGKLLSVSLPIVGGNLMLMGYNLVDMFLLGRVSPEAVASSGSAGMYMWLAGGLILVGRMGAEIGVAQAKGKRDAAGAEEFARNSLFLSLALGLAVGAAFVFAPGALIGFLNIQEAHVAADATDYLHIIGLGVPAIFVASAVASIFTGAGNSRASFVASAIGLGLNAVLDPLFIFTLGMGVRGAAIATVIAQWLGCALLFYWLFAKKDRPFERLPLLTPPAPPCLRRILRWTVPISLENMLFTFFAMVVARQVAVHGADAITVSRIGSQAESLCWLVCLGFSSGMTAFVGQNFGAGQWLRIRRGVRIGLAFIVGWGVMVSVFFLTAGRWITGLFVPEEPIVSMGGEYLRILAFCQVFFCLESLAAGAFRGLGRTAPPSVASIVSNALRVPVVHFLGATGLGLNGIWLGITLTAVLRGIWVFLWFVKYERTNPKHDDSGRNDTRHSVRAAASREVPSVRLLP